MMQQRGKALKFGTPTSVLRCCRSQALRVPSLLEIPGDRYRTHREPTRKAYNASMSYPATVHEGPG